MQTPIFDFVQQYQQGDTARFHMPGHKGRAFLGCDGLDITEIAGADNLQHPELGGVIAQSEQNATALFGTAHTYYSAGGSSACISAMLYLAMVAAEVGTVPKCVLAGRNAHKVFVQACALLDLTPSWLYPDVASRGGQGICGCEITPDAIAVVLHQQQAAGTLPIAVYITSPDYLGNVADVAGLAAVCARYALPLLVDNAHGAYLKFLQPSQHPIDLGAAMCCDSAHKTLPVLTGGAYLQVAHANHYPDVKAALSLFSSTSPSYLILQSLDLCNAYLAGDYPAQLATCIAEVDALKAALRAHGYLVCETEPLKLVLDCRNMRFALVGQGGEALADYLRTKGIEPEFADPDFLVCMMTPQNTAAEIACLKDSLLLLDVQAQPVAKSATGTGTGTGTATSTGTGTGTGAGSGTGTGTGAGTGAGAATPRPHKTSCSVRQALFSTGEEILVENAVGRTCRMPSVSCPPAIPIVVSGEVITAEDIALFRYYGIETVDVIAECRECYDNGL